jgi:hypothetical protein
MTMKKGPSPASSHTVQVVSVPERSPIVVLFLGGYRGLLVHWDRGRNHYCPGAATCPPNRHKIRSVWKGYAPVDLWDVSLSIFLPRVLEVTESLEHSLAGRDLAGEIWALRRGGVRKNKEVEGQWTESRDPASIRPPFPIEPILQCLYHTSAIELGIPNPMPSRTVLEAYLGAPPAVVFPGPGDEEQPAKPTEEQLKKLREFARGTRGSSDGRPPR